MKANKLLELFGKVESFSRKNAPALLSGSAIVGVIATAYSAFKAGPRAQKILEEYRKDMRDCRKNDKEAKRAVKMETAKKLVPVMAPTVLMASSTIGAIIGSNSVSSKRIAVLSAAYTLSDNTVKSLNTKMEELLGEKKARQVKDAIMQDKLNKTAEEDKKILADSQIVMPSDGTVLCKDLYSGRLFYSSAQKIQQAVSKCSYDLISDMWLSLNEFYDAINSPQLERIPMGDDLGWDVDDVRGGQIPVTLTALLLDDGKPVLCMDYDIAPRRDMKNLY